jgi:hypothetical protein
MRIIQTHRDLQVLKQANMLPKSYMAFLEEEWHGLFEALGVGESREEFSLHDHGYMVVLEAGDYNLEPVGIEEGLRNSWPEYVERIPLKDVDIYRIGVLYNNDYMMLFYSVVNTLDEETEAWLKEQAE